MRVHVLVEGSSEEALFKIWLERFLPKGHAFKIIKHRGKGRLPGNIERAPDPRRQGLLDQLPAKLRAFGTALDPNTDRVLVLVDLDNDDCRDLKRRLENLAKACDPAPVVLFRIAIEETEAFYLGDRAAIKKAFPHAKLGKLSEYEPDSICGAWELFQDVIGEAGRGEDKVGWARKMGPHLGTAYQGRAGNRSPSFRALCTGLLKLIGEAR